MSQHQIVRHLRVSHVVSMATFDQQAPPTIELLLAELRCMACCTATRILKSHLAQQMRLACRRKDHS